MGEADPGAGVGLDRRVHPGGPALPGEYPVRRLPPIQLVEDWDDPAIRSEPVPAKGRPAGEEPPRRFLGGVPADGQRPALAASSSGGDNDATGGLFVLRRDGGSWRVTDQARYWVS